MLLVPLCFLLPGAWRVVMVDREKVTTVLSRRFHGASAHDIAAAANAIVGLGPEYLPVDPADVRAFDCLAERTRLTVVDVAAGRVQIFRRVDATG